LQHIIARGGVINMDKEKCVIYTRVSTIDQAEHGYSLDAQQKACKNYAQREGYTVEKIYVERGESAKTADRTEFQKMIHYVMKNAKKISAVIIWKNDRFARNLIDLITYREKLEKMGIRLISATEVSSDTPSGILISNILGSLSQFENELKSERTVTGMKEAVLSGKWMWRPLYGYKLEDKRLVIDEVEGPIVKELFSEYIKIRSYEECRKFLKTKNVDKSSYVISKMLENPAYIGMIDSKLTDYPVKGLHEPLIAKEVFEKVQDIISKHYKTGKLTFRKKFD